MRWQDRGRGRRSTGHRRLPACCPIVFGRSNSVAQLGVQCRQIGFQHNATPQHPPEATWRISSNSASSCLCRPEVSTMIRSLREKGSTRGAIQEGGQHTVLKRTRVCSACLRGHALGTFIAIIATQGQAIRPGQRAELGARPPTERSKHKQQCRCAARLMPCGQLPHRGAPLAEPADKPRPTRWQCSL